MNPSDMACELVLRIENDCLDWKESVDEFTKDKSKKYCQNFPRETFTYWIATALAKVRAEAYEEIFLLIKSKFSYYACGSHSKEKTAEEIIEAIRKLGEGKGGAK